MRDISEDLGFDPSVGGTVGEYRRRFSDTPWPHEVMLAELKTFQDFGATPSRDNVLKLFVLA